MSDTMMMSSPNDTYDVIVVGAGPVGQTVVERARAAGMSVALVEKELVGGECSYWGCIPSKAMLRPVVALHEVRRVEGTRQAVSGSLDAAAVLARRDHYVSNWADAGQATRVQSGGTTLVRGHGRLEGPRRVAVATPDDRIVVLTARVAVVVAVGSGAAMPDMPGIAEARAWTNRTATDSEQIPSRLAVVGGGPVGVEMATAWQALGSSVTLLAREPHVLPQFEDFARQKVGEGLKLAGVELRTNVTVTALRRPTADGPVTLVLDTGAELESDEVLFAIGRIPLTADIGLETVGLAPGVWLDVDDACRVRGVDGDWLFAVGDVNRRALLTHQGKYQARAVGNTLRALNEGRPVNLEPWSEYATTADSIAVPQVVFTDPEATAVGLTEDEARRRGHRITVVDVDIASTVVGSVLFADGYEGQARMIVDEANQTVLGVTIVGSGLAELLHSATIAVVGQVPVGRLWHAVAPFPTISEVWLRLLEAYRDAH